MSALAHYNPMPRFGLRVWDPYDDVEDEGDGWCIECGDEFHYDDVGGYNPPCSCGMHCRSCHEAEYARDEYEGDYDDEPPCRECGGWHVMSICPRCNNIVCVSCGCDHEDDPS
jgi:hypothetical protein